jgi:hypothetical protein
VTLGRMQGSFRTTGSCHRGIGGAPGVGCGRGGLPCNARRIAISANMTMPPRSAAFNNISAASCHAGRLCVAFGNRAT